MLIHRLSCASNNKPVADAVRSQSHNAMLHLLESGGHREELTGLLITTASCSAPVKRFIEPVNERDALKCTNILYLKWESSSHCHVNSLVVCLTGALAALSLQASPYLSGMSGCGIRAIASPSPVGKEEGMQVGKGKGYLQM